jgi:hypothetical protein
MKQVILAWNRELDSVQFKTQPNNHHLLRHKKLNQKQVQTHIIDFPKLPRDTQVKVTLVAKPLLTPVMQKLCRYEQCVFTRMTFEETINGIRRKGSSDIYLSAR